MKFLFGAALIAVGSFLANEPAMAHQAVAEDDDGDAYLLNRKANVDLEPITKVERTSVKYPIVHAFSGSTKKTRGHLIVFTNKLNN